MQKFVGDEFGTAHSSGTLRRLVKALIGKVSLRLYSAECIASHSDKSNRSARDFIDGVERSSAASPRAREVEYSHFRPSAGF
jgi:hypothetical protein